MKALILVGGFGTRLRPLTFTVPKPLVDFGDKPILCHQVEALAKAGVKEIILAINQQQPDMMLKALKIYEDTYNIKITCSLETEPLGTAGPLRLAADIIRHNNPDGLFFVFNSDVICDFPLEQMLVYHKTHGKEGTLIVTQVEDPSKYGVIIAKEDGQIQSFVEKPEVYVSNKINAGLYLFNVSIIDRIEARPTSIEKEIFPIMAKEGQLHQLVLDGYWMDIGQPKDYLTGQKMFLNSQRKKGGEFLASGENIHGDVWIHPSAQVDPTAQLGPNVAIGENCRVGPGCKIYDTAVFSNTKVNAFSLIQGSIIGWQCTVGKWVRISGLTVIGENVQLKDETFLNGSIILPHKSITQNYPTAGTIVM